jgi:hypothetical protein
MDCAASDCAAVVVLLHHSSEIVLFFWNTVSRRGSFDCDASMHTSEKDCFGINQWFVGEDANQNPSSPTAKE